ncbi:hypothetical protein J4526_09690 [Desulfurococcaceae archaeon MEX13E-LK6-19]|nr:hypothetical protein J4526_09690 [Desulfurococcaceae archaeon MEX13E-LK6-19]
MSKIFSSRKHSLYFTILLIVIITSLSYTCYGNDYILLENKEVSFTIYRRYVGFYTELKVISSSDYGYSLLIFTGEGIFAYGYYMEKRPEENGILLYRVSGDQNRWFLVGKVSFNETITLALFLDTKNNTVYFRINNKVIKDNTTTLFEPQKFRIIVKNIDRFKQPPVIATNILIVMQSDDINDTVIYNYTSTSLASFLRKQSIILILEKPTETPTTQTTSLTKTTITTTTTITNATYTTSSTTSLVKTNTTTSVGEQIIEKTTIIAIILIIVAVSIFIYYLARRSHGP